MRRIVSVVLSVVLLLSITAGIDLSAYADWNRWGLGYADPLSNKYVIDEKANQFDYFEAWYSVEEMKMWAQGKLEFEGHDEEALKKYAEKIGITDKGLTEYQKIAKIYQYLNITHIYDKSFSCSGLDAILNRRSYCQTFTWTVNALCKIAGIECWSVDAGKGPTPEPHSWNIVKIDGKYYEFDAATKSFLKEPKTRINNYGTQYWRFVSANNNTVYEAEGAEALNKWLAKIGKSNLATSAYSKRTIDNYGILTNPKTGLTTPSVVSTTATSEGVVIKFKGVSNADWYEVWTAPIDGVVNKVTTTKLDTTTFETVSTDYIGEYVYYDSGLATGYRRFDFSKVKRIHSIDKNESGQYQCFLENADGNGVIVLIVAQNVKGQSSLVTEYPNNISTDDMKNVMSQIATNYLESCNATINGKVVTGLTAAEVNKTNYALYKSNAKHLATNGNHSYAKIKTIRAAGAGTQGADLYECKNCLQRQVRYTDAKMLSTPKLSSVENVATGVKITWGKVSGAAKYRVYYKTANGSWTKIADTTSTSYTWTGAKSGTKYTFTVRCITSDGKAFASDYDKTGKTITYIAAPKLSSVENVATGVKITWAKSAGAAKYRVYYKSADGWTKIADTTSTSYTWTGAKSGTKYTFTVRCITSDGKMHTSSFYSTGKSITYIAAPKLSSVENVATGVKITWAKSAGAAKYRVYYKSSNGWTKIADTTSTSYTWTGAKSGTKYTFTVRCITSDGKSHTSSFDSTGKSITYIAAPKISSLSNISSGVEIKWGKVTGAVNYKVYRKTGNESWQALGTTTGTSFVDKTAKKGTKYTYTVRCISKDGKSFTSGYDPTGKSITR